MPASNPHKPEGTLVSSLPIALMCPSPTNPRQRFNQQTLEELAATIKDKGVLQPITVRPNPNHKAGTPIYEIVIGERRWRASKLAGLVEIPAFWRELTDKDVLEIQTIENIQREVVHPIEEAEGYRRLIKDYGYTADTIATSIGLGKFKKSYVYGRLKLCALGKMAREAFYEEKIDASTALLIARIPGETLQNKALKDITTPQYGNQPMSFRDAKAHIQRNYMTSLQHATFSLKDAKLVPAAGSCEACPKRSGNDLMLTADVGSTDVCTDPKCFNDKREARHLQLLDEAAKRKIPVLRGKEADKVMPNSWELDDQYVKLDARCDGDGEGRTFREILGAKAPVAAAIEQDNSRDGKHLVEVAEVTQVEAALKKAGWKPSEASENDTHNSERMAKIKAENAEIKKREAAAKAETARRQKALAECLPRLTVGHVPATAWPLLRVLFDAWFQKEIEYEEFEGLDAMLLQRGYTLPDEYDFDDELPKVLAAIERWPIETTIGLMLERLMADSCIIQPYELKTGTVEEPRGLLAFAKLVGVEVDAPRIPSTAKVQPAAAVLDSSELQIGDRVRVGDDVRSAPGGKRRKCCGREGTIESADSHTDDYSVRFGNKSTDVFVGFARSDLLKLIPLATAADAPRAAQAHGSGATTPAAPASGKTPKAGSKAAKAKTDPAPATPANEPAKTAEASGGPVATPVKTAREAWPFPTGSRPAQA